MELKFEIGVEIENDWDDAGFNFATPDGRKRVIASMLRRDVAMALNVALNNTMQRNGVAVTGMTVGGAEWIGWDNAAIAREVTGN